MATGLRVRWCPSHLQMSDALTKDQAEPAMRLRAAMRDGRYQIEEEGRCMEQREAERERKEKQREANRMQNDTTEIVYSDIPENTLFIEQAETERNRRFKQLKTNMAKNGKKKLRKATNHLF